MKIPAQCLTVRIRAEAEAERVSRDEIGKVFAIKAVGWKKSTPIVKFKSAREDGQSGESGSSVLAPTSLAPREQETETSFRIMEKEDGGPIDILDSANLNVPLQNANRNSSHPDESPSIDHFQQHVVQADTSLNIPDCPSAKNSLVRNKSQDQDFKVHKKEKPQDIKSAVADTASILAVHPGSLTLDTGRVQKVYVVHFESPANFYVTPSLEKLKEFQK